MNFKCNYGNTIYVVGDIKELGSWNPQKAFKLTWTEGHNWIGKMKIVHDNQRLIQYKYIIASSDFSPQQDNVQWERGPNRYINLYTVSKLLLKLDDEWEHFKVRIAVSIEALNIAWSPHHQILCYANLPNPNAPTEPIEMKQKRYIIKGNYREELFWTASFRVPYNLSSFSYKLQTISDVTNPQFDYSNRKFDLNKFPKYASQVENYRIQGSTRTKFDFRSCITFNFDAVTENIWIGSFPSTAQDIKRLQNNGIKAVLNLQTESDMKRCSVASKDLKKQYQKADIVLEHFPIIDMDNDDLALKVKEAACLIAKLLKEGGKIYVHCTAGKYRSPHAVICYLWFINKYSLKDAIELVQRKRKKIKISICEDVFRQKELQVD